MNLRRVATLFALALVLGTVTVLSVVREPEPPAGGSARSSADDGRRAAFLLLAELGLAPELWERPAGELLGDRARPGLLWMPRVPRAFDPEAPPDDPLERARARGSQGWARYREFAAAGGVLALPAVAESAAFLAALGLEAEGTAPFELENAPDLSAGLRARVPGGEARGEELTDSAGLLVARRIAVGDGAVALVAAGEWQENSQLGLGEHALLLVRLVERLADGGPVRFDESVFAGPRGNTSALALAFGAGGRLTWHLLALLALLVWSAAWVREFPRDPEPLETLSPLLRSSSTAAWLERHGRFDALAGMLRDGTLASLGAAAGEEPAGGRAAVAALARGHGRAGEAERWVELFVTRPVADLEGLVALDRDLRELQARNTAGTRRHRARAGREQE